MHRIATASDACRTPMRRAVSRRVPSGGHTHARTPRRSHTHTHPHTRPHVCLLLGCSSATLSCDPQTTAVRRAPFAALARSHTKHCQPTLSLKARGSPGQHWAHGAASPCRALSHPPPLSPWHMPAATPQPRRRTGGSACAHPQAHPRSHPGSDSPPSAPKQVPRACPRSLAGARATSPCRSHLRAVDTCARRLQPLPSRLRSSLPHRWCLQ